MPTVLIEARHLLGSVARGHLQILTDRCGDMVLTWTGDLIDERVLADLADVIDWRWLGRQRALARKLSDKRNPAIGRYGLARLPPGCDYRVELHPDGGASLWQELGRLPHVGKTTKPYKP